MCCGMFTSQLGSLVHVAAVAVCGLELVDDELAVAAGSAERHTKHTGAVCFAKTAGHHAHNAARGAYFRR